MVHGVSARIRIAWLSTLHACHATSLALFRAGEAPCDAPIARFASSRRFARCRKSRLGSWINRMLSSRPRARVVAKVAACGHAKGEGGGSSCSQRAGKALGLFRALWSGDDDDAENGVHLNRLAILSPQ
jgi:hypothetical protein